MSDRVVAARAVCGAVLVAALGFLVLAPSPGSFPTGPAFFGPAERPLAHTAWIGLWWAAALNAAIAAGFLLTAPLWAAAPEDGEAAFPEPPADTPARRPSRAWWLAVLAAVLLAGALRWPLAHTGLWSDEAWTVKNTMSGYVRTPTDGADHLVERRPSWAETLWVYYQPTNQVLYSVTGRLLLAAWQDATGREPPAFDEFVVRLPAWLAALGAVAALARLLAEWGLPRAGAAAAFGLAIHPWAIRFGADGRSYSLVVLFAILAALLLTRALRRGTWRAWAAYGGVVFLLLWSHLFSAYLVASLALAAAVAIAGSRGSARTRLARAGRLVAVNAAAVVLVFQLMAPNLSQLRLWEGIFIRDVQSAHLTLPALGHLWTLAAVGMEAREPEVPERAPGAYPSVAARPWMYPVVLGVVPLLAAFGALRVLRRGPAVRAAALGLVAGLPLALLANWINQDQWYSRFGVYGLPALLAFWIAGADALLAAVPWRSARARAVGCAAGLALVLLGFQAMVWPQTRLLLSRPHTPSQEVAAWFARAGGGPPPEPGAALRVVFGNVAGDIVLSTYDPWLRVVATREELLARMAEARRAGRPLLLAYGHPARNRRSHPEVFALLDDPALFTGGVTFDAIEVEHLMRVLRYTGAPPDAAGVPSPAGRFGVAYGPPSTFLFAASAGTGY